MTRTAPLCLLVASLVFAVLPGRAAAQTSGTLRIHFLDVGQGDAAVLVSPGGETVLIDNGPSGACAGVVTYLQALGITHLDYHIATHYHADHIGCTQTVLSNIPLAGPAIDRGGSYGTATYANYLTAVGTKRRTSVLGEQIVLDSGSVPQLTLEVDGVNANGQSATDENDLGVAIAVRFGNFHALLGGDISGVTEAATYPPPPDPAVPPVGATARCVDGTWSSSQNRSGTCSWHRGVWYWVCPGLLCDQTPTPGRVNVESGVAARTGQVEIYKVHHHGSTTSSSATLAGGIGPKVGIVSVGNGNSYGHPTGEALGRLHNVGTQTYWTQTGAGAAPLAGWDTVTGTVTVDTIPGSATFSVHWAGGSQTYPTWEAVVWPPTAFGKSQPAFGARVQSTGLVLSWLASPRATSYRYCIDSIDNAACDTAWVTTGGTNSTVTGLDVGTTYYWHVQALNTAGYADANAGTWWSFTTAQPAYPAYRTASDYDRDGRTDVAVYRPAYGTWFWLMSSANNTTYGQRGWGLANDVPVAGDYDGDGIIDPTVYRPATGTWFILKSSSNLTQWTYFGWGQPGDIPVPGDYDGDGVTDGCVFRPATGLWYVRPSAHPDAAWSLGFGKRGDVPVAADYDGDHRTDIAVYRPSTGTWFVLKSGSGFKEMFYRGWGADADVPVPGDYDGDGKADLAVYRPAGGGWIVLKSSASYQAWSYAGWGDVGDVPVPGDFDGDGRTDYVVFRPSSGTWYVRTSNETAQWSTAFGNASDWPLGTIR
jgi:beta-lactamase superfamily II metal-dependent hydrolase